MREQSPKAYWDRHVESFDAIYSRKKSRLGNFLDSLFRRDMYGRFDYAMQQAESIAGRTFLDVGCGTGRYSLELAQRGARLVVGLDFSERMIGEARERAKREHLEENVIFIVADFMDYKPEEQFDVCLGMGLFDYISEPGPVLAKMNRCIKEKAILSFPRLWTWRAPLRKARLSIMGCPVYFYTRRTVERLLRDAGFRLWRFDRIGKLHCIAAEK